MPLPEQEWFTLPEIAERWRCKPEEVLRYGINGKIVLCAAGPILGQKGYCTENRIIRAKERPTEQSGPFLLVPNDLRRMHKVGHVEPALLALFPWQYHKGKTLFLCPPNDKSVAVQIEDLIILRVERDRFEQEYGIGKQADQIASKERKTLLELIAALVATTYGWSGEEPYKLAREFVKDAALKGFTLSDRTVGEKLKAAAEFLPSSNSKKE